MTKALVIAADNRYLEPLETLVKSICYHNDGLVIYIFNQDIAPDWFRGIAPKVALSKNTLRDVKLSADSFGKEWQLLEHIDSLVTYARYYIPEYVTEDRVVYLDSDTLVTGSLEPLFTLDMADYPLAAVREAIDPIRFNAGMLLINNRYWRDQQVTQHLIALTNQMQPQLINGDQQVLNTYFHQQWLALDDTFNYQIGFDLLLHLRHEQHPILSEPLEQLPLIIHYLSQDKPWNTYSSHRLREVWWFYRHLEWSELILAQLSYNRSILERHFHLPTHLLVVTDSQSIEYLEALLKALPDCYLHIAAYTAMGHDLLRLATYPNLILHPIVTESALEQLLNDCHIYLDINFGPKFKSVLDKLQTQHTPILSFSQSGAPLTTTHRFDSSQEGLQQMVQVIKELLKKP